MPGTFSSPPRVSDPDTHYGTCATHVPWCMLGSLTSGFLWSRWRGKRSRRMRNPQFYVSGKRPMAPRQKFPVMDTRVTCHIHILYIHDSIIRFNGMWVYLVLLGVLDRYLYDEWICWTLVTEQSGDADKAVPVGCHQVWFWFIILNPCHHEWTLTVVSIYIRDQTRSPLCL